MDIAKECGVSNGTTIHKWMRKFDIPCRGGVGAVRDKNFRWKGGQYVSNMGYRYILVDGSHPRAFKKGKYCYYIPEHIKVMEEHIGRYTTNKETVHHKNGVKLDNRIGNLQLLNDQKEHQELEQKILLFSKQLIWGDLKPKFKTELQKLFQDFNEK
jgi:hypothetical protein